MVSVFSVPRLSAMAAPLLAPSLTGLHGAVPLAAAPLAAADGPAVSPAALKPSGAGGGAPPAGGGGALAAQPSPSGGGVVVVGQEGVFVTPQSLANFAGATLAVTLMWNVAGIVVPGWDRNPLVGLGAAAMVGAILYLISESDPQRGPVTTRDRLIGIFVALINTLVIFSAAVGSGRIVNSNGSATATMVSLFAAGTATG